MTKREQKFQGLVGRTITAVDARSINCISLTLDNGDTVELETEATFFGIPIINLNAVKPQVPVNP